MIDWAEISAKFDLEMLALQSIDVPPKSVIEKYKAHYLTGGLVKSPLANADYEDWYLAPSSNEWTKNARRLIVEVNTATVINPKGWYPKRTDWKNLIREAIVNRIATNDFLFAWLYFGSLVSRGEELIGQYQMSMKQEKRAINSGIKSDNTARLCWYSHWLLSRSALEGVRKSDAEKEIYKLIGKLYRNEIHCAVKADHYDLDWFGRLLVKDKKRYRPDQKLTDEFLLSETFSGLKPADIRRYARHRYIKPEMLPRLAITEFLPGGHP